MAALPKVDRRLNIVFDIEMDDDSHLYIHSTPISRQVFEAHARVIARAFTSMYGEGITGPFAVRVALPMLLETAKEMDRDIVVKTQLLPEIWRLTNVMRARDDGTGFETLPFHEMIQQKLLDEDSIEEVKSTLVFFTLASWVHSRPELKNLIYPLMENLGLLTGSWDSTDFITSLPTSTPAESTGEKAIPSSTPS